MRRNAATRSGGLEYRATSRHSGIVSARPGRGQQAFESLAVNAALRVYVQERLAGTVASPDGVADHGDWLPSVDRARTVGRRRGDGPRQPGGFDAATRKRRVPPEQPEQLGRVCRIPEGRRHPAPYLLRFCMRKAWEAISPDARGIVNNARSTGWRSLGQAYRGRDADMDLVSHGDGRRRGAISPAACGSISGNNADQP